MSVLWKRFRLWSGLGWYNGIQYFLQEISKSNLNLNSLSVALNQVVLQCVWRFQHRIRDILTCASCFPGFFSGTNALHYPPLLKKKIFIPSPHLLNHHITIHVYRIVILKMRDFSHGLGNTRRYSTTNIKKNCRCTPYWAELIQFVFLQTNIFNTGINPVKTATKSLDLSVCVIFTDKHLIENSWRVRAAVS
jgi:hypothetical protein